MGAFGAFLGGMMKPVSERWKAEEEVKRKLDAHASQAKLDKALSEWEFYSPEERAAVAPELDRVLKQKKGYSSDLLGKGEQGYKFLQGVLDKQRPIQDLEKTAGDVASRPINLEMGGEGPSAPLSPVSLPALPVEGSNIPRVQNDVMNLPAADRALAAQDVRKQQSGIQTRSQKISEIRASDMDPQDKEVAIANLYGVPPGVLAMRERKVGGSNNTALGTIELVNPDNPRETMLVQATRSGQFIRSGTQEIVPPEIASKWWKRHPESHDVYTDQEGNRTFIDKEVLGLQARRAGSVVANVPEAPKVAETKTPLVNKVGNITGEWGSRSGPRKGGTGTAGGTEPLRKSGMGEGTLSTIGQLQNFQASLDEMEPLVKKHADVIGRVSGNWEKGKAWLGVGDPEIDNMITTLQDMKNTFIYLNTGKQINKAEMTRLDSVMPDIGSPPQRFANNLRRFKRIIGVMRQVREMGRVEGATPEELNSADRETQPTRAEQRQSQSQGGGGFKVQAPNGKTYTFPSQEAADKFKSQTGVR